MLGEFRKVASKSVMDSDGFYTDYTWYKLIDAYGDEGLNVFVYGDNDVYLPEDGDWDFAIYDDEEASAWFENYVGFEEDLDDLFERLSSIRI